MIFIGGRFGRFCQNGIIEPIRCWVYTRYSYFECKCYFGDFSCWCMYCIHSPGIGFSAVSFETYKIQHTKKRNSRRISPLGWISWKGQLIFEESFQEDVHVEFRTEVSYWTFHKGTIGYWIYRFRCQDGAMYWDDSEWMSIRENFDVVFLPAVFILDSDPNSWYNQYRNVIIFNVIRRPIEHSVRPLYLQDSWHYVEIRSNDKMN